MACTTTHFGYENHGTCRYKTAARHITMGVAAGLARTTVARPAPGEIDVAAHTSPIPRRALHPIAPVSPTEVHVPAFLGVLWKAMTTHTEKRTSMLWKTPKK